MSGLIGICYYDTVKHADLFDSQSQPIRFLKKVKCESLPFRLHLPLSSPSITSSIHFASSPPIKCGLSSCK